jgi:S1-C subfamily serine protease
MHWAAFYDQEASAEVLAEFGAPLLSKRQKAQQRITNVLSVSDTGSGIPIIEKALQDGAWINGKDGRGFTPLGAVVNYGVWERNNADRILFLLSKGADPNTPSEIPFRYGRNDPIVNERIPLSSFVRSNEATMNWRGGRSKSKANVHIKKYAVRAMKALMDHGAKVAGKDSIGRTPLHWAAKTDNLIAAKMLIEAGAIVTHRDNKGATPLDLAESSKMIAILKGNMRSKKRSSGKKPIKSTSGSGFFFTELGHVITNSHVVNGCKSISIRLENSSDISVTVANLDKRNDIALLMVEKKQEAPDDETKLGVSVVSKGQLSPIRTSDVRLGEAVMVAGYPYGKFVSSGLKVTSGIVSGTKGLGDNSGQFQLDAAIQPGNSGGPIFDRLGNIVGIVVSQLNKLKMAQASGSLPENTNFGIKAGAIRTFLEANGVPARRSNLTGYQSTEALAQIAEKQSVMVQCHR